MTAMRNVQLVVVQGKPQGKVIPIAIPLFRIGRSAECHLRPNSEVVSSRHAELAIGPESVVIRDLGSRAGTFVNNQRLRPRIDYPLTNGALLTIGPLTFAVYFQAMPAAVGTPMAPPNEDDSVYEWMIKADSLSDDRGSKIDDAMVGVEFVEEEFEALPAAVPPEDILRQDLFPIDSGLAAVKLIELSRGANATLENFAAEIKERLRTDHVRCSGTGAGELENALREPNSPVRMSLGEGFYKLVVIEARSGLNERREFEFDRLFIPYVRVLLFDAFEIEPTEDFHPEQISQVLKDEPCSLFCFLESGLIPEQDIQRLRIFTQEVHRVVFCGRAAKSANADQARATSAAEDILRRLMERRRSSG
jgi:pSer/pThr/pTyr-binding forkhead associated (FHA) protein